MALSNEEFNKLLASKKKVKADLTTAQGLATYAKGLGLDQQVNKILETTPHLSMLQRLGKGLGAFNPAEAFMTGTEKGVASGVAKYATGIVQGIGSALIGRDYEGDRRTFSDVAAKYGIKNSIAKFGIGVVGDILLDPTTYFGGAIVKGLGLGAKTATNVAMKGLEKASPDVALGLTKAVEGISDAFGGLFLPGYKSQEGALGDIMAYLGKKSRVTTELAEDNLARLGTGIFTKEQNKEIFTRLAGGKRLEYALRKEGETATEAGQQATAQVMKGATGQVKKTLEEQMKRGAGFGEELAGDEFYRSYFPFIKKDKVDKFIYDTRGLKVGSEDYLKEFKNVLTDENLEQNVAQAFFTRENQIITDKNTRIFLQDFVGTYGKYLKSFKTTEEAKNAGYELLREKGMYGTEVGYIPKWDKKLIDDMFSPEFKSIDILAKATGFDAVTSLFKRSVTGLFAPFHVRNYVSGMVQNYEVLGKEALDPRNIVAGQKLAYNAIKGVKMGGEQGKVLNAFSEMFGFSTFYKNEFDNALNAGESIANYEKAFSKTSLVKTIKTAGLSAEGTPFKLARQVGNYVEMQQKATAYITKLGQLSKGGEITDDMIKQGLKAASDAGFDYRVLTQFESQIMRRIVPFYSFSRKNIELQLKTLGTHPERINQIIKTIENIGEKPSKEEKQGMPDYFKEGFAIKLPDTVDGLKQYITSLGTPIEQFTGLFKKQTVMGLISQTNPLLKVPLEIGIGKDSFRERDLKDSYDAKEYKFAPQIIKDILDLKSVEKNTYKKVGDKFVKSGTYTKYVADPEKLLIARALFTSRGVSYLDQVFDNKLDSFAKFVNLFTGVKAKQFDLELGKSLKDKDQKRALEDLVTRYADVKEFKTLYENKK